MAAAAFRYGADVEEYFGSDVTIDKGKSPRLGQVQRGAVRVDGWRLGAPRVGHPITKSLAFVPRDNAELCCKGIK
ncbi:MAG: hypothetical protein ACXWC0_31125 [Burkholderiales bacterium]